MRWRVGVVLCFFAAYFGIGCREPLKPNIDRNQAPETWITAAPFDTITIRDPGGNPVGDPSPGTIPVRFHVYWAGADKDGAVAGFYWAVVETLPRPVPGQGLPSLPGPKPQDYHFTTKTDSFFVFSVAEDIPDRQHAFFIYSVDNQGKPDPTPARFVFTAQDRFPPIPIFDECTCAGTVYFFNSAHVLVARPDSSLITDQSNRFTAPRDTCPSNSTITFRWHGQPTVPQVVVTGYRYKLDEPQFVQVGPEVTRKQYLTFIGNDTIPPSAGEKIFTLRVVDQAFGTRDSTRRFQYNYSPDTWLAGPDPNSPSFSTKPNGEKYVLLSSSGRLPPEGIAGSLLSPDSTLVLPALRPEQRHFFEVWKDTLFLRSDDDTVHMNSWVIFHSGGFDRDSKYRVAVSSLARQLPGFPGGPVLESSGPNGSPVAFRAQVLMKLWPNNALAISAISNPYPIFDPNDVFNNPRIGGYQPMIQSGRAYAFTFALDGDNSPDRRIGTGAPGTIDPLSLVAKVENGTATAYERGLRRKVLSFYVDKAPYLVTDSPLFFPRLAVRDTFTTPIWDLRLVGADEDPFLKEELPGGPAGTTTLRRRITIVGMDLAGGHIEVLDPNIYLNQSDISVAAPSNLAPGDAILRVEICDCDACEDLPGSGRCRITDIPVFYNPSSPAKPASLQSTRPGTGDSPLRSKRP